MRTLLRKQRSRLRGTLESYLRGKETAKYLQDQVVTERNGRYVLVVKAEQRGGNGRQNRDVDTEESRQRGPGHVVAAAHEADDGVTDPRQRARRAGPDARREERELVPRE